MKKTLNSFIILLVGVALLGIYGCEDEKDAEKTTAEKLVGVWLADATVGDLGNTTAGSGSLAGAGWTSYQLTLNESNTFSATGANAYDIVPYGDGDGIINYSGTYTIDDSKDPMWIDLTCTASDNIFFTTVDTLQPCQPGIFELDDNAGELMIQYGSTEYGVPRPTEFMTAPGTLVKQ